MKYTQVFTETPGYLLCVSNGTINSVEAYVNWGEAAVSKALETGNFKILFDNRTLLLDLDSWEIDIFSKHLDEMDYVSIGLRLAVLSNPANEEISQQIELALTNRSASYKRFKSQEDAVKWLESRS